MRRQTSGLALATRGGPHGIATIALCLVLLAGCASGGIAPSGNTTAPAPCAGTACPKLAGVNGVHIFVEPRDGEKPVVQAIASATHSVWVEV